ncbi:Eco57I restriction-modification methylase domain-containing protein [Thermococcus sp.]|uniref:Eco57I restriction-modification methylase domain-containing protein n=1 Tax=Thermococcus sp. TaxID=35749 RepID=UPI0025EF2E40|nr:DNA methyltransferase [Thermococcus sp.]
MVKNKAEEIRAVLEGLEKDVETEVAVKAFREIFTKFWGFSYENEEIEGDYLNTFVEENTGVLKVIAITEPEEGAEFFVIYGETWSDTVRYRQRLIKKLLEFTGSLGLDFANFILILDIKKSPRGPRKFWKLIVPLYQRHLESTKLNIYTIDPEDKKLRTLAWNLAQVAEELEKRKKTPPASEIRALINEHMLVQPLTEQFFEDYKKYYLKLKDWIKANYGDVLRKACPPDYLSTVDESVKVSREKAEEIFVERAAKTFAHTFFNRLMFVYFLQKKGWIVDREALRKELQEKVDVRNFVRWILEQHEEYGGNFYGDYLRTLFLYAMNSPRRNWARLKTPEIKETLSKIPSPTVRDVFLYGVPYFNGGLFSPIRMEDVNLDEIVTEIDDSLLRRIIVDFFEGYNFTVMEETPYEVEVAVDPAMLGKIYESLIAEEEKAGEEEERRASGIFYTPRAEVDFMCRMAVYQYLRRNTGVHEELVRKFVFTPAHEWKPGRLSWGEIEEFEKALNEVKVVDPAAGSGAFLVGMYHLLIELHEKLTEDSKTTYKKKLEIIRDNIYGVDIKEWAIRVAKLRLWLALIEEEEKLPNEPILPNLETKLTVGDSLAPPHFVLKVSGRKKIIEIPLAKFREGLKLLGARKGASEAIVAYKGLVRKYYMGEKIDGKPVTLRDIEKAKWGVLQEFLEMALEEELKAKEKKEIRLLLEAVKKEDFSALEKPPFIWELDFPDAMLEKKGFDVVIANPPYVRQEKIYPEYYDLAEFQMLPKKEQERLKKDYKNKIKTHMETIIREKFKGEMKLPGRSDLYAYFFIQSVNLLNPKGSLVFITSNSWLDVDFGKALQEFFLRFTHLRAVIDYTRRSFEQADVNTVITVLTRKPKELFNTVGEECVNFILLKRGFEGIDSKVAKKLLECYAGKVKGVEVFGGEVYSYEDDGARIRSVKAVELAKMGGFEVGKRNPLLGTYNIFGEYSGMKWGGILIRAPRIFYVILDKGKGKLVRLGEIAEVRRGFTTGANEFFYLEPIRNPIEWPLCPVCGRVHKPEEGLVAVRNKAGWEGYLEGEFLKPVVKSPQEVKTYRIRPKDLKLRVFLCNLSKEELKKRGKVHALKYVEWGEGRGYQNRTTLRGRKLWWDLGASHTEPIAWAMIQAKRHNVHYNPEGVELDHNFFGIELNGKDNDNAEFYSILVGTFQILVKELLGRAYGGGSGPIKNEGVDIRGYLTINPAKLSKDERNQLLRNLDTIPNREIKSIFEELGLPKPNRDLSNINPEDVSLDKVMPDRRELDRVIFEALGLTEEEQLEVYRAVVELVKARLVKAKTFSRKKG